MQCENGNLKVVSAAALNTSFRVDIWNERWISKAAVNRHKQLAGFAAATPVTPQPGEA